MDTSRGLFIVVEGSDGSGKATQLNLVKERLEAAGYDVETFDFPQYDQPSSYFVKRYLDGGYGASDEVGPYTSSLFYALDRFETASRIREALNSGKIVISNRFTGSSMAHQGTKISNAEQRRGFFIWLDNLEFEMLRIPRPDISFILRVPADISEKLMAVRVKKDIHEADRLHLERTVLVYDDMAQLFPKDFRRIDCVRGGELLSVQDVNAMLWERISVLLPPPPPPSEKKLAIAHATQSQELQEIPEKERPEDVAEPAVAVPAQEFTLTGASGLLVQKIERATPSARVVYPEKPQLYQPGNLVPVAQKAYDPKANTLLGLYAKIVAGLAKKAKMNAAEAHAAAAPALLVAASATVHISADDPGLEELVIGLLNDPLTELQAAGAHLFAQAISHNPKQFEGSDEPAKRTVPTVIAAVAEEYLAENHIGQQDPVQLLSVWPRNENDLIADMLYAHTGLPLRTIQDRIAAWPMNRKLDVFEAYLSDTQSGAVLEKAHYSWDLLTPYTVFRQLQCLPSEALEIQPLTPRHGYDIPKVIEDAGLTDTYEKCFDLSLELYSDLQAAGHQAEAQYATLQGHNQRWKLTTNGAQLAILARQLSDQPVVMQMLEKQSEAHPTIAEQLSQNS